LQSVVSRWRTTFAALNQSATWLGVGMLVLIWASIDFHLRNDLDVTRGNAAASAVGTARSVEAFTRHAIDEIDGMLVFLRAAYERDPQTFALSDYMRDGKLVGDLTMRVSMIGSTGLVMSSQEPSFSAMVDVSGMDHFRTQTQVTGDELHISKPIGVGIAAPAIQLSRRLRERDGSFAGVITAALDPARLSAFYDAIDMGGKATIALLGSDGIVRAVGGGVEEALHPGAELMGFLQRTLPSAAGHFFETTTTGQENLIAWRHVARHPLFIRVAKDMNAALAPYDAKARRFRGAAWLFSLLVLVVIAYSAHRNGRLLAAEAALRQTEANASRKSRELATTLEHMSQGILMVDGDGTVAVMNRRATQLLELPDSFTETRPSFRDILHYQWQKGEFGENVSPEVMKYIRSGGLSTEMAVYERARPNGIVLEIRNTPLPDGGIVRTYTDITERTNAAAALAAARDAAEAAGRARSSFLAMMSHEIRTPLNGVIGMADLLIETPLNDEQRRYAGTLRNSADHLLQVINDVLDFSKLEADRVELHDVAFDLEETVDSVVEIVAPRAFEKGLFISASVDPSLPDRVCGDPAAFRQILLNLAGNAVKFTAQGHVCIEVARDTEAMQRGRVGLLVRVRDTGIGIPAGAISSLFKEFAQVDGSISRRFGGTGLGLAISRQLVERMGGAIGVTSTEGEGSVFTFTARMGEAPEGRPIGGEELSAQRILVMAANPAARDHYAAVLRRHDAWVEVAGHPAEAMARLRERGPRRFDAVLVDEASGDTDSGVLAEAVRSDLSLANLRMVLATTASHRLAPGSIHRMAYERVLGKPAGRREIVSAFADMSEPAAPMAEPGATAAASAPAGSRGRILLAEDNATNRLVIGTLLDKLGFSCRAAVNGLEAVAALQEEAFDLVLMDVMMPEMDGYAATRAIRALSGERSRTPIVALTANVLTADIKAALAAGMDDFATKPISRDKLEQVIQRALEKSRAAAEQGAGPASRPAAADEAAAFDQGILKLLLDEIDPDSARMILDVFVEDTTSRLETMRSRLDDRGLIARECHAIKSAAATFGLTAVSARAAALEERAAAMEPDALAMALADLSRAFAAGRARLPQPGTGTPAGGELSHVA
jgi:signal transduction histidine kinase/CheY-like chemotaxis protein/HPt (histidine-containing phosphotransfer) domain-containing protein